MSKALQANDTNSRRGRGMTGPRHIRDVLQGMPELRRFSARLEAPDFPTPAEAAAARRELAHARGERQAELPLAEHAR